MKSMTIIKPVKISNISVNKNIWKTIRDKYKITSVLSFPVMLHLPAAEASVKSGICSNMYVTVHKTDSNLLFKANLINSGLYSHMKKNLRSAVTLRNLLNSNNALNHLVDALWSIYKSNNLRLSHSFLKLIRLITEKNSRDNAEDLLGLSHVAHIQKKFINILKRTDFAVIKNLSAIKRTVSFSENNSKEIYSNLNLAKHHYSGREVTVSEILANTYSMSPLLERIYEGIESGMYLYNSSSYKNTKTLYRLTNSLWKVYLGQNLELSRSFTRLIKQVSDENESIEYKNRENNLFTTSGSLKNLVRALRQAFSGNNLELRNSMIDLFSDIHQAGKQRNVSICQNKNYKSSVNNIRLFHREIVPVREEVRLTYKKDLQNNEPEIKNKYSNLEQEAKKKIKNIKSKPSERSLSDNMESMIKTVLDRINREQKLEWHLEKLQRGIF